MSVSICGRIVHGTEKARWPGTRSEVFACLLTCESSIMKIVEFRSR